MVGLCCEWSEYASPEDASGRGSRTSGGARRRWTATIRWSGCMTASGVIDLPNGGVLVQDVLGFDVSTGGL